MDKEIHLPIFDRNSATLCVFNNGEVTLPGGVPEGRYVV